MSFNKKTFLQALGESKKKKTSPKVQDRIIDLMGQWAHPGEVTRIPSNRITMQGVPYPVLGVGNNGQQQMMFPGKEYAFPGSQYVDEFPLLKAQKGLSVEQRVNKSLGEPMKKAHQFADQIQPDQDEDFDNARHYMAGALTNKAIQNKFSPLLKYTGIPQVAGFLGSNILGLGHELSTLYGGRNEDPRPWSSRIRELFEDVVNNAIGATAGTIYNDPKKIQNLYFYLSEKNLLPDGIDDPNGLNLYLKKTKADKGRFGKYRNGGDISIPNLEEGNWLDRYQEGGATTADSLAVYNAQIALNKFYDNEVKNERLGKVISPNFYDLTDDFLNQLQNENLIFYRKKIEDRQKTKKGTYDKHHYDFFGLSPEDVRRLEMQGLQKTKSGNKNIQYYRDIVTPMQNLGAPFALIDKRIQPKKIISYYPVENSYPGGQVIVFDYDPLAVKPYYLRTPKEKIKWEQLYGNGDKIKQTPPKKTVTNKSSQPSTPQVDRPQIKKVVHERIQSEPSFNVNTPARLSTINKPKGDYAVDYFDENLQPQTNYFPTPEIADMFMKERMENKMYGPSMTRRGVYEEGGQLQQFAPGGFTTLTTTLPPYMQNRYPVASDIQGRGMSAQAKGAAQFQIKEEQAISNIQKENPGYNRYIAALEYNRRKSPKTTTTISQGRQRTKKDEEDRRRRNYEYAINNGLMYNFNTGDIAQPGKTVVGEGWEKVQAPALVQSFASLTPSGNLGAGRIGAESFTNMNPITGPITSAGRLTQHYLRQNPYGFNKDGVTSNILPYLGVVGDIFGVAGFKFVPGSQRIINQANKFLNYGSASSKTPVFLSSVVPSGKNVDKIASKLNQKGQPINWVSQQLTGSNIIEHVGQSGKKYKIEFKNARNIPNEYEFKREFNILNSEDPAGHFKFKISKQKNQIPTIDDLSFFNNDVDAANDQLRLFLSGIENSPISIPLTKPSNYGMLPFGSQNLSMYSQPIMNVQAARLARQIGQSGQPRLQLLYNNNAPLKELNTSIRTGTGASSFRDQLVEMWPKIENSYKLLQQNTGTRMKRPRLLFNDFDDIFNYGQANDITVDMLKQSKYSRLKPMEVNMLVPEYGIIKHYKQGGQTNWLDKYN